jgi:hypothetical protein
MLKRSSKPASRQPCRPSPPPPPYGNQLQPGVTGLLELPRLRRRVSDRHHARCDACIDADPRQTPDIRGARGKAIAARKRAIREWEEAHPGADYDPDLFRRTSSRG